MISQKNIVPGIVLTAVVATYHTAPSGLKERICNATLCNSTAGVVNCSVHLVGSGDTAAANNQKIALHPLGPGETYGCPELIGRVLEPGQSVQALGLGVSLDVSAITQTTQG